jgi:hypothetical protein
MCQTRAGEKFPAMGTRRVDGDHGVHRLDSRVPLPVLLPLAHRMSAEITGRSIVRAGAVDGITYHVAMTRAALAIDES